MDLDFGINNVLKAKMHFLTRQMHKCIRNRLTAVN
jgi:hypothetical protein